MTSTVTEEATSKYLTFGLGDETYGVVIMKVQEIIGIMPVTKVPNTPKNVRGVINLRGKVIPVVDLRLKFHLEAKEDTNRTCIIVMQVERTDGTVIMGLIVDEVCEVVDLPSSSIEPAPSFGTQVNTEFIIGMGKLGDKVVTLLDMDRVLTQNEMSAAEAASE